MRGCKLGLLWLAAGLGVALTGRLGWWQLDRAQQKLDLQDRIAQRAEQPALPLAELARDAAAAQGQHYRRIVLRGRWLADRSVALDNRQMDARQGFFIVTPLLLASGDAVLVQRGWTARDFADRSRVAAVPSAAGEVSLEGRIAPPPAKLFALGSGEIGPIRQNLELADFAREIGVALRPLSVQQTAAAVSEAALVPPAAVAAGAPDDGAQPKVAPSPSSAPLDDGLLRHWPRIGVDVGKHHGYAFQWFALSALIAGLTIWFQILRPRFKRPHG